MGVNIGRIMIQNKALHTLEYLLLFISRRWKDTMRIMPEFELL